VSVVSRIVDVVAPPRLGRSFRWLLASSWVSNIGDGIALAAGPLLVASQTRNAILVALAAVGLQTDVRAIRAAGLRPLGFGLALAAALAAGSLVAILEGGVSGVIVVDFEVVG
jgi:hypothetical protein